MNNLQNSAAFDESSDFMDKSPKYIRSSEIIRAMRPFQRQAAKMLIEDVLAGTPPRSVEEAKNRYRDCLGEGFWVDDGKGWHDDIRDTSVFCLIKNGFAKGKAVKLGRKSESLTEWVLDKELLIYAARLETEHGGNLRQTRIRDKMMNSCTVFGRGDQAVYTYTDGCLDKLGYACTKIGRHLSGELGAVADRVLSQYGTGNAGFPVLQSIFRTDDAVSLETTLHRHFEQYHLKSSFGTEWFEIDHNEVVQRYHQLTK